jgi:integrase
MTALIKAARKNRSGHRDATMILIAYRHGLRARELVNLRWEQVDLRAVRLHVSRVKNGTPSIHPLTGHELRSLRRLQRENPPGSGLRSHDGLSSITRNRALIEHPFVKYQQLKLKILISSPRVSA